MRRWCAVDWLVAGYATFVAVLVVVCGVPRAPLVVGAHAALLAFMWWLPPRGAPWERLRPGDSRGLARLRAIARFLRYTYPALLLTPFFEEVALFVNAVAPGQPFWFEPHLIAADRALFGGTPAAMLSQGANAVLDEVMHGFYRFSASSWRSSATRSCRRAVHGSMRRSWRGCARSAGGCSRARSS
jgi:hypothetical protein